MGINVLQGKIATYLLAYHFYGKYETTIDNDLTRMSSMTKY